MLILWYRKCWFLVKSSNSMVVIFQQATGSWGALWGKQWMRWIDLLLKWHGNLYPCRISSTYSGVSTYVPSIFPHFNLCMCIYIYAHILTGILYKLHIYNIYIYIHNINYTYICLSILYRFPADFPMSRDLQRVCPLNEKRTFHRQIFVVHGGLPMDPIVTLHDINAVDRQRPSNCLRLQHGPWTHLW